MRKTTVLLGVVAAAVIGIGAVVYAQPGPGWMMQSGYAPGGGYGPGIMGGPGWGGPGWMHGCGRGYGGDVNLTADQVKSNLEHRMLNPRLKVGAVTQTDDIITATIVTKDKDVLVQKFSIDRHRGFWRPEND